MHVHPNGKYYSWRWLLDSKHKSSTRGTVINHGLPGKLRIKVLFGHYQNYFNDVAAIYDPTVLVMGESSENLEFDFKTANMLFISA